MYVKHIKIDACQYQSYEKYQFSMSIFCNIIYKHFCTDIFLSGNLCSVRNSMLCHRQTSLEQNFYIHEKGDTLWTVNNQKYPRWFISYMPNMHHFGQNVVSVTLCSVRNISGNKYNWGKYAVLNIIVVPTGSTVIPNWFYVQFMCILLW